MKEYDIVDFCFALVVLFFVGLAVYKSLQIAGYI